MRKLVQFSMLAVAVAMTTASTPFIPPVQPVMTLTPVAIIEGGTVSTLPKSVRARGGKVVILRGRADKPAARPKRQVAATPKPRAKPQPKVREAVAEPARTCACSSGGPSTDLLELRNSEANLRVMILGPDGLTRTRYVPAPPAGAARHSQDD